MAPTRGEVLFVDANVLLTATEETRSRHRKALALLAESGPRGWRLAASGQVLREYLAVATRPVEANGLGIEPAKAVANVAEFLRRIHLCDEDDRVARRLRRLAAAHGLRGRRLHDGNIAATMICHGMRDLVTENGGDFATFEEIRALSLTEAVRE